ISRSGRLGRAAGLAANQRVRRGQNNPKIARRATATSANRSTPKRHQTAFGCSKKRDEKPIYLVYMATEITTIGAARALRRKRQSHIKEYVEAILIAVVIAVILRMFVVQAYRVS